MKILTLKQKDLIKQDTKEEKINKIYEEKEHWNKIFIRFRIFEYHNTRELNDVSCWSNMGKLFQTFSKNICSNSRFWLRLIDNFYSTKVICQRIISALKVGRTLLKQIVAQN